MHPAAVLGTSYTALPIARSLGRRGVPVYGFEFGPPQIAAHSRFLEPMPAVGDEAELVGALRRLADRAGTPVVVLPTADRFVRFLREFQHELEGFALHHAPAGAASLDLVAKSRAAEALTRLEIPHMESHVLDAAPEPGWIDARPYPCIVKPEFQDAWLGNPAFLERFGYFRALRIESTEEAREALPALARFGRMIVQEFIPGPSEALHYFVGYRDAEGRHLGSLVGCKRRTYPDQMGTEVLLESVHAPELEALGRDIMERLEIHGPAGIDFKLDARTQQPKVIEVNLRFGSSDGIALAAGVDLPWVAYRELTGQPVTPEGDAAPGVFWHWLERDLDWLRDYRREHGVSLARWLGHRLTHRYSSVVFAWDDLGPAWHETKRFVKRVFGGLTGA